MVSEISPGSTPALSSAARIAAAPSSCAGVSANAPRKLPTGVRAAEAITMLVMCDLLAGTSDGPAPQTSARSDA